MYNPRIFTKHSYNFCNTNMNSASSKRFPRRHLCFIPEALFNVEFPIILQALICIIAPCIKFHMLPHCVTFRMLPPCIKSPMLLPCYILYASSLCCIPYASSVLHSICFLFVLHSLCFLLVTFRMLTSCVTFPMLPPSVDPLCFLQCWIPCLIPFSHSLSFLPVFHSSPLVPSIECKMNFCKAQQSIVIWLNLKLSFANAGSVKFLMASYISVNFDIGDIGPKLVLWFRKR
jgi:hypothetical protein